MNKTQINKALKELSDILANNNPKDRDRSSTEAKRARELFKNSFNNAFGEAKKAKVSNVKINKDNFSQFAKRTGSNQSCVILKDMFIQLRDNGKYVHKFDNNTPDHVINANELFTKTQFDKVNFSQVIAAFTDSNGKPSAPNLHSTLQAISKGTKKFDTIKSDFKKYGNKFAIEELEKIAFHVATIDSKTFALLAKKLK